MTFRCLVGWIVVVLGSACESTNMSRSEDRLWVNRLGMSFAPVPIVDRESRGEEPSKSILMATFETTEKQVSLFRRETGSELESESDQEDVPACDVSWTEAVAFCEWLTERERSEGFVAENQRYRLPTDHEWSCAVGIGHLESSAETPEAKSNGVRDGFPWGSEWPPPKGSGNLCGRESRKDFPDHFIKEYHDGLGGGQLQSGVFEPNQLGLHDLSGSVWEWCEDRFREGTDWRVLRGGSWKTVRSQSLLSSHRTHDPASYRSDSVGFRCVLAVE